MVVSAAQPQLGPERFVQAGGTDITGLSYSVPSLVDWNGDNLPDLMTGEGSSTGKVRVYLNQGQPGAPAFASFPSANSFYAQSNGATLSVTGGGCLGAFPRFWSADNHEDLLLGQSDGKVRLYHNTGTNTAPSYDAGTLLQAGPTGQKTTISAGSRATPSQVDWNNDGQQDLLIGEGAGNVRVHLNQGTNAAPDFASAMTLQANGLTLNVSSRASPTFADLDRDGLKDLLIGDANGRLGFYKNTGTPTAPAFAARADVLNSAGQNFQLTGSLRTRPFICDWDNNGQLDVLLGYGDGKIRLYTITPEPATLALMAVALAFASRRRVVTEPVRGERARVGSVNKQGARTRPQAARTLNPKTENQELRTTPAPAHTPSRPTYTS
jgi:hypothetical protein